MEAELHFRACLEVSVPRKMLADRDPVSGYLFFGAGAWVGPGDCPPVDAHVPPARARPPAAVRQVRSVNSVKSVKSVKSVNSVKSVKSVKPSSPSSSSSFERRA